MSTQPQPATNEGTVETVNNLLDYRRRNSKAVADAHNAALAAKDQEIASDNLQLAAEREKARRLEQQLNEETQEGNPQEYGDSN